MLLVGMLDSPYVRRAAITGTLLEVPFEHRSVSVFRHMEEFRAINPLILHGQTHGAAAQGIGQALLELCYFDRNSAQNMAASFMDYAIPRADVLPTFNCELIELPATSHRYGIRPGGEGGTTPALAATINAVVDALKDYGVRHLDMPATGPKLWSIIQAGQAKLAAD